MKQRILIVDDEPAICDFLSYLLQDEGYRTAVAGDGEAAARAIEEEVPDLILLDIGLPGENGLILCQEYRRRGIPAIIVSSHDQQDDIIAGLELGAEDYIRKPYNNRELILRVRKVLGRGKIVREEEHPEVGELRIDLDRHRVHLRGREIRLTPTEYGIIEVLARRKGHLVTWQEILKLVWKTDQWEGGRELVKVNIRRLRKKIEEDPASPLYILTRRGRGELLPERLDRGGER